MIGREKKRLALLLLAVLSILAVSFAEASACDIDIKVVENKKKTYEPGDIVVLKVSVKLTHRRCRESLKATKIRHKGMEIISSSPWESGTRRRHYKTITVKITKTETNKSFLSAERTCDKEGGFGRIELKTR
jgi:hypothetical protein